MSNGKSSARFLIENARVTRVNRLAKVAFVSVYAYAGQGSQYLDVTDFALPENIGEGESVIVQGDVSMRKPQQPGGKWTIQLVARKWQTGKEELTPPLPQSKPKDDNPSPPASDDDIPF